VCTRAARNENPNPNPNRNSHDHCLLSKWKYVCAYSSVQLDKSRVEKEFTIFTSWGTKKLKNNNNNNTTIARRI